MQNVYFCRCKHIALGNGTACRETEKILTEVVKGTPIKYWLVLVRETEVVKGTPIKYWSVVCQGHRTSINYWLVSRVKGRDFC